MRTEPSVSPKNIWSTPADVGLSGQGSSPQAKTGCEAAPHKSGPTIEGRPTKDNCQSHGFGFPKSLVGGLCDNREDERATSLDLLSKVDNVALRHSRTWLYCLSLEGVWWLVVVGVNNITLMPGGGRLHRYNDFVMNGCSKDTCIYPKLK